MAFIAGFLAGGINVMVGAGTLISFPLLLLAGHPPLTATIANTIGLVPASATGVLAYRDELRPLMRTMRFLLPASMAGGVLGATLLLSFPAAVFVAVVPWLIALGTLLVLLGPTIKNAISARSPNNRTDAPMHGGVFASRAAMVGGIVGVFALGTYGGYFSAAQGILLLGLLGILTNLDLQRLNGIKNLSVLGVNGIAALVYMVFSPPGLVNWAVAGVVALGAASGGFIGGRLAKRLSPTILRWFVVVVGVVTVAVMLLR